MMLFSFKNKKYKNIKFQKFCIFQKNAKKSKNIKKNAKKSKNIKIHKIIFYL